MIPVNCENQENQKNLEIHGNSNLESQGVQGAQNGLKNGRDPFGKSSQVALMIPVKCKNQENQTNLESHVSQKNQGNLQESQGAGVEFSHWPPGELPRIKIFYLRAAR